MKELPFAPTVARVLLLAAGQGDKGAELANGAPVEVKQVAPGFARSRPGYQPGDMGRDPESGDPSRVTAVCFGESPSSASAGCGKKCTIVAATLLCRGGLENRYESIIKSHSNSLQ